MRKRLFLIAVFLIFCGLTASCDTVFPMGNIRAIIEPNPLVQGTTADIEIIYPNTGGTFVHGWKDHNAEVIDGADIVKVSGLSVTGLKSGEALIRVSTTTIISEVAIMEGYEERVYSVDITIRVVAEDP